MRKLEFNFHGIGSRYIYPSKSRNFKKMWDWWFCFAKFVIVFNGPTLCSNFGHSPPPPLGYTDMLIWTGNACPRSGLGLSRISASTWPTVLSPCHPNRCASHRPLCRARHRFCRRFAPVTSLSPALACAAWSARTAKRWPKCRHCGWATSDELWTWWCGQGARRTLSWWESIRKALRLPIGLPLCWFGIYPEQFLQLFPPRHYLATWSPKDINSLVRIS